MTDATLVTLAAEGVVTIGALGALWTIFALRDTPSDLTPPVESPVIPPQTVTA